MESFRVHLGSLNQIPLGQGRCFTVGIYEVAIFRSSDGRLLAIENRCPQGEALVGGSMNENKIECPYHGHQFDLLTGQEIGSGQSIRTFKVWEENGKIMLLFVFPTEIMVNNK